METGAPVCPPAVIERIQEADLNSYESAELFDWINEESSPACEREAALLIGERLSMLSDPLVRGAYASTVATYAAQYTDEDREKITAAFQRIGYDETIAFDYFLGLRKNRIDLRGFLKVALTEDWRFTSNRSDNAATWHYYMYLASLDEPEALQRLADKIAATSNGNDVTNFLKDLATLEGDEVTRILESYSDDQRHADGVSGPGLTIAKTVEIILQFRLMAKQKP